MSESNCKTIRSRIEESPLGEDYGQLVQGHLSHCGSCRQFEKEQRSLRELVGSLGTVQAPADFDFKLRARMANSSSNQTAGFRWRLSPLFASAAGIVLFVGVIAGITYVNKRQTTTTNAGNYEVAPPNPVQAEASAPKTAQTTAADGNNKPSKEVVRENQTDRNAKRNSQTIATNKPKRSIVSEDFSSTGAPGFRASNQFDSSKVFPIEASLNSLKVSVDDGRGNARTISLPGVSFGSQRVLVSGNQFAQKGVW